MNCGSSFDSRGECREYFSRDGGFSGLTHAVSTLATVLVVAAFFPTVFSYMYNFQEVSVDENYTMPLSVIFLCIVCTVGSCMLPDLDNTKSRAESALGVFGSLLSGFFRASALFIQSTFKLDRDADTPDPHRGFWHTSLGALALSAPVFFLGSKAESDGGFNFFNATLILVVFVLSYLSVCTFFGDKIKQKAKRKPFFALTPYIFGVFSAGILYTVNGVEIFSYALPVASSIFWGMMLHIFGDCHTKSGAPIFAPFTAVFKKKVWWSTSFFPIESGGEFEKNVLVKLYSLAAVVGGVGFVVNYF